MGIVLAIIRLNKIFVNKNKIKLTFLVNSDADQHGIAMFPKTTTVNER